jgi:hypothetical protein
MEVAIFREVPAALAYREDSSVALSAPKRCVYYEINIRGGINIIILHQPSNPQSNADKC